MTARTNCAPKMKKNVMKLKELSALQRKEHGGRKHRVPWSLMDLRTLHQALSQCLWGRPGETWGSHQQGELIKPRHPDGKGRRLWRVGGDSLCSGLVESPCPTLASVCNSGTLVPEKPAEERQLKVDG